MRFRGEGKREKEERKRNYEEASSQLKKGEKNRYDMIPLVHQLTHQYGAVTLLRLSFFPLLFQREVSHHSRQSLPLYEVQEI
jgi:hypothetical protein